MASAGVRLPRLPPEVIVCIFDKIRDRRALLKFVLVCRLWRTIVLPRAYGSIYQQPRFHDIQKFRTWMDILEASPQLGRLVGCWEDCLSESSSLARRDVIQLTSLLQYCPNIVVFHEARCRLLDNALIVALAENSKSLEDLSIPYCRNVTRKGLLAIATNCAQLTELDISHLNVADTTIRKIVDGCPKLNRLWLEGCTRVRGSTVDYICEHATNLSWLSVAKCDLSPSRINSKKPENLYINLE
ncbi:hypothetical protein DFS34DRAFT_35 [Phlyctochytrium arcticum]|nr:hypothetical protein DFS34DRAFT_35 [Phlyctochytrium arcticum]